MAIHDTFGSGITGGPASVTPDWTPEDAYWRSRFATQRYVQADRGYEYYQPAYRYGFESANRHRGRQWDEVEADLRSGWDTYEHRGESAWDHIKDAVRDAWDRISGHDRHTESERDTRPTY